jgi:hypothetical protein
VIGKALLIIFETISASCSLNQKTCCRSGRGTAFPVVADLRILGN